MEISERNLHLKLQEMCDCYLETDFRKQMHGMAGMTDNDAEENGLKYLALAIMFAVTERARKLSFKKKDDKIKVIVESEQKSALPAPSPEQFDAVVGIVRNILHFEEDHGESDLALGLRSGDLALRVKVGRKPGKEVVKFKFV